MLRVAVVTLFPEMLAAVTDYGVTGRGVKQGLLEVTAFNPREYTQDVHRTVDDRPYGGGPGMVMKIEPLRDAIEAARTKLTRAKVIYLSPQGQVFKQSAVKALKGAEELILVAGRYEGIDERLMVELVDEEWSIGDYVLSGGELPAMVVIDALARTIPGVLGHDDSASEDSFFAGLLDYPHYTRPEEFQGKSVPSILLSGDHEAIRRWRLRQALDRTWQRRPDLLEDLVLDDEQQSLLDDIRRGAESFSDSDEKTK